MSQLNTLSSQNSKKFESEAKKIKEQETKLISQKNILSEVDFQSNINKLKLEIKNYNDNRDKINNDFFMMMCFVCRVCPYNVCK